MTNLVNNYENELKRAIREGISSEAVSSTLKSMLDNTLKKGFIPSQVKRVVISISNMKDNTNTDYNYKSDTLKTNGDRLNSAIINGISSSELVSALESSTIVDVRFLVPLISIMKKRELSLVKQNGYQKIKTNN